ncbi:hypothetical protein E2C01_099890 [Portunus trituberculatus]|uniref:Uncharacterized protein n=1 Tax=Portunus trituberculatus TaxID=210409 RepID=A0A5B7KBJ5_PORTR|nr:hypothetical protein [Portunus trituberculatus]
MESYEKERAISMIYRQKSAAKIQLVVCLHHRCGQEERQPGIGPPALWLRKSAPHSFCFFRRWCVKDTVA